MLLRLVSIMIGILIFTNTLACTVTMGYRTNEKLPYINATPDNEGVYKTIYEQALANINCKLNIVRAPKKRILFLLERGDIDFYPGLGINDERASYIHFIKNGLKHTSVTISRQDEPDIHTFKDLNNRTVLIAQGANYNKENLKGAKLRFAFDLSVAQAIKLIQSHQADFYSYSEDVILSYLKSHPNTSIKLHQCCGGSHPMYLGFSVNSKHFSGTENPLFNRDEPTSFTNQIHALSEQSIAFQFQQALLTLEENGLTQRIWQEYFIAN